MAWQHQSNRVVPGDWNTRKRAVRRRDGDTCHACHHPGADEIDHIVNVAAGGTHDLTNLAPIHGGTCPTCHRRCHIEKTADEARAARARGKRRARRHPSDPDPEGR